MNTGSAMAQFAVLAGAVFAVIGAVLCAVAYPLVRTRMLRVSPMQRARVGRLVAGTARIVRDADAALRSAARFIGVHGGGSYTFLCGASALDLG